MPERTVETLLAPYAGHTLFCGFSGGADSTALLLATAAAAKKLDCPLLAVHFEHGLRGAESRADAAFCRRFAARRKIPFRIIKLNVPEHRHRGESVEEAARRLRLEEWRELASAPGSAVLLAHHADDRAENLILRLARGGNVSSLVSPRSEAELDGVTYLRPLLDFSKIELLAYLKQKGVRRFRTDATNADCRYARNRVRHKILPEIAKLHPGASSGVRAALDALACDAAFLERAAAAASAPLAGKREAPLAFWRELDPALRVRVLRIFLAPALGEAFVPTAALCRRFSLLLAAGHGTLELPAGFRLTAQGGALALLEALPGHEALWDLQSALALDGWTFTAKKRAALPSEHDETFRFWFDADKLPATLVVRPRRDGDRLRCFGGGTASLKKLFTDSKCGAALRSAPLVLAREDGEILAVFGLRRGSFAPVTAETRRIVELAARRT